jgi:hypothetical protein
MEIPVNRVKIARSGKVTHLITETAHASADGLLDHLQGPDAAIVYS